MMRAAQVSAFGSPDDIITVADAVPRPTLSKPGTLLLKVHAVSLSPSDYRMTSGAASLFKPPKNTVWPYIPGGDVCGLVEEVLPEETKFAVGDPVIATWNTYGMGGIAEYAVVETRLAERKPDGVSFDEGAAMADSPVNAMLAAEDAKLAAGDRLLVLGGSGAMGTSIIQLAKDRGVGYIVATSTDEKLVKSLGADVVINYRERNWWEAPEVKERPFDVVIDCAEGVAAWRRVLEHGVLKSGRQGGRFLAVVVNEWHIEIRSWWQMLKWGTPVLVRTNSSMLIRSKPSYKMLFPAPRGDSLPRLLKIVEEKRLEVVLDPSSPFAFTTDGVRAAFNLMIARGAHGKVVISICNA